MSEGNTTKSKKANTVRPVFLIHNIVDAEGNVIEGAKLNIIGATRNGNRGMAVLSENPGAQYTAIAKID